MPLIEVPELGGQVEFPDEMSMDDISSAIGSHLEGIYRTGVQTATQLPGQVLGMLTNPAVDAASEAGQEQGQSERDSDADLRQRALSGMSRTGAATLTHAPTFSGSGSPMDPMLTIPRVEADDPAFQTAVTSILGRPVDDETLSTLAAGVNSASGFASGMTSPVNLAALGLGGMGGAVVKRLIALGFGVDIGRHIPAQATEAGTKSVTGTPQERKEAYLNLGISGALVPGLGLHGLRPSVPPGLEAGRILGRNIDETQIPPDLLEDIAMRGPGNAVRIPGRPAAPPFRAVVPENLSEQLRLMGPRPPIRPKPAPPNIPRGALQPEVPETAVEPTRFLTEREEELATKALQAKQARQAGARTKEQIREMFPEMNRQQAAEIRDLAWPKGETTDASQVPEATEVHGDLQPPPGEGTREVPAVEGGEGVQPQAQRVAQAPQVPLSAPPPPQPNMVRLYHGSGGTEGAGASGAFWTSDFMRARSFGPNMEYVDVSPEVADAAQQVASTRSGTASDHILPDAWVKRARPFGKAGPGKVYDLDQPVAPAAPAKPAELTWMSKPLSWWEQVIASPQFQKPTPERAQLAKQLGVPDAPKAIRDKIRAKLQERRASGKAEPPVESPEQTLARLQAETEAAKKAEAEPKPPPPPVEEQADIQASIEEPGEGDEGAAPGAPVPKTPPPSPAAPTANLPPAAEMGEKVTEGVRKARAVAGYWKTKQGSYTSTPQGMGPGGASGKAIGGTYKQINERKAAAKVRRFEQLAADAAQKGLSMEQLAEIDAAHKNLPKELRQPPKPAAADPEAVAKEIGFTFRPGRQIGSMSMEGLTAEEIAKLKAAGQPVLWDFTDPNSGITFYAPEGSTRQQILDAHRNKLAEMKATEERLAEFKRKNPLPGKPAESEANLVPPEGDERVTDEQVRRQTGWERKLETVIEKLPLKMQQEARRQMAEALTTPLPEAIGQEGPSDKARGIVARWEKRAEEASHWPVIMETPWTDRMKAAKDANEGRTIIHEHEDAINAVERSMGLKPSVGKGGGGFGSRGFSTMKPSEWRARLKEAKAVDPVKAKQLSDLIEDGNAMAAAWEKLLAAELEEREARLPKPTLPGQAETPKPTIPESVRALPKPAANIPEAPEQAKGSLFNEMRSAQYPPPKPGEPDLVLIGCSKTKFKRNEPIPAQDLYTGQLFTARRKYAEGQSRPWMILSGYYGIVDPKRHIEHYDVELGQVKHKDDWRKQARANVIEYFGGSRDGTIGKTIEVHAGAEYVKNLEEALQGLGIEVKSAMQGKGIGEQLSAYNKALERPPTSAPAPAPGARLEPTPETLKYAAQKLRQAEAHLGQLKNARRVAVEQDAPLEEFTRIDGDITRYQRDIAKLKRALGQEAPEAPKAPEAPTAEVKPKRYGAAGLTNDGELWIETFDNKTDAEMVYSRARTGGHKKLAYFDGRKFKSQVDIEAALRKQWGLEGKPGKVTPPAEPVTSEEDAIPQLQSETPKTLAAAHQADIDSVKQLMAMGYSEEQIRASSAAKRLSKQELDDALAKPPYISKGDINPPKFATGTKVKAGTGGTAREGTITGTGPKRPGEEQTYFVNTNLGEAVYKESDLQPSAETPEVLPPLKAKPMTALDRKIQDAEAAIWSRNDLRPGLLDALRATAKRKGLSDEQYLQALEDAIGKKSAIPVETVPERKELKAPATSAALEQQIAAARLKADQLQEAYDDAAKKYEDLKAESYKAGTKVTAKMVIAAAEVARKAEMALNTAKYERQALLWEKQIAPYRTPEGRASVPTGAKNITAKQLTEQKGNLLKGYVDRTASEVESARVGTKYPQVPAAAKAIQKDVLSVIKQRNDVVKELQARQKASGIEGGTPLTFYSGMPIPSLAQLDQAIGEVRNFVSSHNFTAPLAKVSKKVRNAWNGFAMKQAPRITEFDRLSGELGVRLAHATIVAREKGLLFADKVLREAATLPDFDRKFGTALTEDNLRDIKAKYSQLADEAENRGEYVERAKEDIGNMQELADDGDPAARRTIAQLRRDIARWEGYSDDAARIFQEKADAVTSLVGQENSPFQTEDQYQTFLSSPEAREAVGRHIRLWQHEKDPLYRKANDLDPDMPLETRGTQTGARINLKAVIGNEGTPTTVGPATRSTLIRQASTRLKKDVFGLPAKGTGASYEGSYREIMANGYQREFPVAAQHEFINRLLEAGLAKTGPKEFPEGLTIKGEPTKAYELKLRPWVDKKQWIHIPKSIAFEYESIVNLRPASRLFFTPVAELATKMSVQGFAEGSTHVSNLLMEVFTGVGPTSNPMLNALLKVAGRSDLLIKIPKVIIKAFGDRREQMLNLAEIGAAKEAYRGRFLGALLTKVDQGVRLTADSTFKGLADAGLVENTETNRREFIGQVGNYNKRTQPQLIRWLRDTHVQPFATAMQTFNVMGIRRMAMAPGVKASNLRSAAALRAEIAAGWIGFGVVVSTLNYLLTGDASGPPGTKLGAVGWIGDDGRLHQFDVGTLTGYTRGARITGLQGLVEAKRAGLSTQNQIAAALQGPANVVVGGISGPLTRAVSVAYSGMRPGAPMVQEAPVMPPQSKNDEYQWLKGQAAANIATALQQANPAVDFTLGAMSGRPTEESLRRQFSRYTPRTGQTPETIAALPQITETRDIRAYSDALAKQARKIAPRERIQWTMDKLNQDEVAPEFRQRVLSEMRRHGVFSHP